MKQDKPKVKHPKAHIDQINEDQTQRTNIKSSKGKNKTELKEMRTTSDTSGTILNPPIFE